MIDDVFNLLKKKTIWKSVTEHTTMELITQSRNAIKLYIEKRFNPGFGSKDGYTKQIRNEADLKHWVTWKESEILCKRLGLDDKDGFQFDFYSALIIHFIKIDDE